VVGINIFGLAYLSNLADVVIFFNNQFFLLKRNVEPQ